MRALFFIFSGMKSWFLIAFLLLPVMARAQPYTRQDSLRGSNGRGRDWWDVLSYHLDITIDTSAGNIKGTNTIIFKITGQPCDSMQIDLQEGMILDDHSHKEGIRYAREGNIYWRIVPASKWKKGETYMVILSFHGVPRTAKNPPWDGGFISTRDSLGNPWMAVACQGLGASSWWPCKDYQGDEPDSGMNFTILQHGHPDNVVVSNGKYLGSKVISDSLVSSRTASYNEIRNPINPYNTTFYIGDYAHYHDTLHGEKGTLDLDFYPLKYNEAHAHRQWTPQVKNMLRCFEYWLGPYPFYEDGYKLVEAPYLGMEHQSAIAYGNGYANGYRGRDLSGTGVGLLFDYIIVHESGHEWFGNSITAQDIADNWIHEGITTYTETLYAQWITNRDSAFKYAAGEWEHIANDYPVIGDYGVNDDKGSDKYYKGAAVVHMVRMMLNDDATFRQLLRGLNQDFYHKIVTSAEVEAYISKVARQDLKPFFDEYLRTKEQPVLEWYVRKGAFHYRWQAGTPGFFAPFVLRNDGVAETVADIDASSVSGKKFKKKRVRVEACGWYRIRNVRF